MSEKIVILVVDDEPINLKLTSQILSPYYKVRVANSGARMLEVVMTNPAPELILLDVMMPNMDGYSAFLQLKENSDIQEIPVIFITAMDAEEDEEKGLNLGAADYITKPIRPAILLARVKTHLSLKHARNCLEDQNSYLEIEISRRMAENQIIQNVSIRALAHLAEIRDTETGFHILRTQEYVRIMATGLQSHPRFKDVITEDYIALLVKSAPLHDIGKVGIPDSILRKQGKLTPDEWVVMKTHAEIGAYAIEQAEKDIQQPVDFLVLAKEIARWHHERWDGSGYPDGLSGDSIPISARIMAVADVFDALVSPRIYKQDIPADEAREIMLRGCGSHFDPDLIDVFIDKFDQLVNTLDKVKK